MFYFASFGFHNSSYDLGSKGPAVKSVIVCLYKRRLLGYGRRFTCEARNHFVSPVYLQWEISSWQICSTVVSHSSVLSSFDATASQPAQNGAGMGAVNVGGLSPEPVPVQTVSENANLLFRVVGYCC